MLEGRARIYGTGNVNEKRKVLMNQKLKREVIAAFLRQWESDGGTLADLDRVREKLFFFRKKAYRIDNRQPGLIVERVQEFYT